MVGVIVLLAIIYVVIGFVVLVQVAKDGNFTSSYSSNGEKGLAGIATMFAWPFLMIYVGFTSFGNWLAKLGGGVRD